MDFLELNIKYKNEFYAGKTDKKLEKYVLSEIYPPIADYENAVAIIRDEKEFASTKLKFLEVYFCFTQVYCESFFFNELESSVSSFSNEYKAIFFYLKSLSFSKETNLNQILESLEKSISFNEPFMLNFWTLSEFERNKQRKKELLLRAYSNIKKIFSRNECENNLEEEYFYNIDNYIDSEIKGIVLNEVQLMIFFPKEIIGERNLVP